MLDDACFRLRDEDSVLTPALAIYPEFVRRNIQNTIRHLGGHPERWRAHVKTAKLARAMRELTDSGVVHLKCATSLELRVACESGARDVLLAYPVIGPLAGRVREIADLYPQVRTSVLCEDRAQLAAFRGSRLGVFLDINPGMDRTGIAQDRLDQIVGLAQAVRDTALEFRGLHYYDGHLKDPDVGKRAEQATAGYRQAVRICEALRSAGHEVAEVVTAGTPCFPAVLAFEGFRGLGIQHRLSPGTLVYNDLTSLKQLPEEYGYRPAALVMARVISHPSADIVTCDAGHKAVSADAGTPTCAVLGRPGLRPLAPSEEHLPIQVGEGERAPQIGEMLYLLPRHICPSVNNFDHALMVENGEVAGMERVDARGREAPMVSVPAQARVAGPPGGRT